MTKKTTLDKRWCSLPLEIVRWRPGMPVILPVVLVPAIASGIAAGPHGSYVDLFRYAQRIFQLDPEIAYCAIDLGMSEQQLHSTQVTCFPVDLSRFGSAKRMGFRIRLVPDQSTAPNRAPTGHTDGWRCTDDRGSGWET